MVVACAGYAQGNDPVASSAEVPATVSDSQVRAFLARHCQECHEGAKPKGAFELAQLTDDFADLAARRRWLAVREQLEAEQMPPDEKPRPAEQDVKAVTDWITRQVAAAEAVEQAKQGRVVLRRLNRVEYANTVHDLLGVDLELKEVLALDGSTAGFDNVGSGLHMSSFALARYLGAGDLALSAAIANTPRPPRLVKKRESLKDAHYPVNNTKEAAYRKLDDGTVVCFCSSEWLQVYFPFWPEEQGLYRFRMSASAFQSNDKPVVFAITSGGGGKRRAKAHLIGYFDAPVGEPQIFEFVDQVEPHTSTAIRPYGLPHAKVVEEQGGVEAYSGPGLAIQWLEVEGPLYESWPPPSHRRIFGDMPQAAVAKNRERVEVVSEDPLADAERILRPFVRRAFRRAATDADIEPLVALVKTKLAEERTFEQAVRAALLAVLVSPDFLFLHERPGKLDDFALASRLSYFLFSSMPDEELLTLAEQKELSRPEVLRQQVERMLQSPKAKALTENFVSQWLNLREIDFTEPSHILYPEFDPMLRASMVRETELFFEEVIRNDLSITNFVSSDWTMLNGRLAKHYGIDGVEGWSFRKIPLAAESHRGGVLTMASVLKVTADGTSTSPVKRGAWVLERLLGTPPPPPPPDVPSLEPDIRGSVTIREKLARHRESAACAGCHAKIDPLGFALENFDCIGGWRQNYRTTGLGQPVEIDGRRMPYLRGPAVDAGDVLPDGERFRDIDELKQLLLRDKGQFARALTEKLVTYATGAAPQAADGAEIEAILRAARDKDYGLRTLIHEIVQSKLFLTK